MPVVSVCIPTFEEPQLALRAVSSALAQRYCDFEIIISDDSRDDTVWDALHPKLNDTRLKYYRNTARKGAVANWNHAISRASGQIYKILHHDDWFEGTDALASFCEPILNGTAKVVFSACNAVKAKNKTQSIHRATSEQIAALKTNPSEILFGNFLGAPSVFAADASLCSRFDPSYLWVSDMEFYARIIEESFGRFEYINTPLVNVSTDLPSQISRSFEKDYASACMEHARALQKLRTKRERVRARAYLVRLIQHVPPTSRYPLVIKAFREAGIHVGISLFRAMLASV